MAALAGASLLGPGAALRPIAAARRHDKPAPTPTAPHSEMIAFKKQLLPVAILCNILAAQASDVQMGDFWVVHYQGGLGKNQVFVADGDPNNIFSRPDGAKSLGVYQFYEEPGKPTFTAYDVEIDCAKNRVRITGA